MDDITMFGDSQTYELSKNDTTGKLEIAEQDTGFTNGLIDEVTGMFNGGKTGSTGASHTTVELLKIWGYPSLANKLRFGEGFKLNPYGN